MAALKMMSLKGFDESSIFPFCSRVFLSVAGFEQGPFAAVCSNLYASEHLKDSFISIKAEKTPFKAVEWYWWFCNSIKQVPLLSVHKPRTYSKNGVAPPKIILLGPETINSGEILQEYHCYCITTILAIL